MTLRIPTTYNGHVGVSNPSGNGLIYWINPSNWAQVGDSLGVEYPLSEAERIRGVLAERGCEATIEI